MRSDVTTLTVLERIAASDDLLTGELSKAEFRIVTELRASEYAAGMVGPRTHDEPETSVTAVRLTTNGRLLMEQLRREEKQRRFAVRLWRWLAPVLIYIAGILTPIATEFVKKQLGLGD